MDKLYSIIDSYLTSDKCTPIIVDVPDAIMLEELVTHYQVAANLIIRSSKYCLDNDTPQIDKMQYELIHTAKPTFLLGLSTHLKLRGEAVLKKELRRMLDMTVESKLVILTFQCREYLDFGDPRLMASSRIIIAPGNNSVVPKVVFVKDSIDYQVDASVRGIRQMPKLFEAIEQYPVICVKTTKTKRSFPDSLISIEEIDSSYTALQHTYTGFKEFDKECGTEKQWEYLLKSLNSRGGWTEFLEYEFGGLDNLLPTIEHFSSFDSNKQWAYYISLRKHGAKGNKYLAEVLSEANTYDDFISGLYESLLKFDSKQSSFEEVYSQRKVILKGISGFTPVLATYLKKLSDKKESAIYYLTDLTQQEKEKIIDTICCYRESFSRVDLMTVLRRVYPDLYYYLNSYKSGIRLIDYYFDDYKYCKVTNNISEGFRIKVNEQATLREYNKDLSPRSWFVDKIDKQKTALYFVDAFGVEYLSYLREKCFEKQLSMKVEIGHCDLPSITSVNKGFVAPFVDAGCKCVDIKELDEVKHSGQKDYNYENTKLPIHIVEELRLISTWVEKIEVDLASGGIDKVVMIADHGASRLAVINESETSVEVAEKGMHSGRCCPKADISEKPDSATEENGFWCLANYDRFKGGRKANVEVHGGASLEEVAVPIIEITKTKKNIECNVCTDSKIVTVSFKKKAEIRLFIAEISDNVEIAIGGNIYQAEKTDSQFYYKVQLPDIKKVGFYDFEVHLDGNVIKKGLSFEIKKEGATERKFF